MTIIAIPVLLLTIAFCFWVGFWYMKDIIDGHGKIHSWVIAGVLFFVGGMAVQCVAGTVMSWL